MTRWRVAAATDVGRRRETNQDVVFADDDVVVIADGMGGHRAGEVAAEMAVDALRTASADRRTVEGVIRAIQRANLDIFRDARRDPDHAGMGTTLILVARTIDPAGVTSPTLFHVGDSRAYQLRDGALRQLSVDHTVAEALVRMGRLTPEDALTHPGRHQLSRGVGVEDVVAIDVASIDAEPGDRILLCSDGLSNELDDDTIARLASPPNDLEAAVAQLVDAAKEAGGRDNISVALLEFDEAERSASPVNRTVTAAPPRPESTVGTRRRRRVGWRVWVGALVVIAIVVGAYQVVRWYAYSSYYLANDAGHVAIYQGMDGGMLWFAPRLVDDTVLSASRLRTVDRADLARTISEPTVQAACEEAVYLHNEWALGHARATTTSTSTTSTTTTSSASESTTTTVPGTVTTAVC